MTDSATSPIHLELDGICRNFGGIHAVRDVSFQVRRGTIHALVGENGAGKSTLSKMIAGVIPPSSGGMQIAGRSVSYSSPRQALADGIAMMEQELALLPNRTVIENVFLGGESQFAGFVRKGQLRRRFHELRASTGFEIDGNAIVGALRLADQQKVEILRAIARNAELIIMDEPTAPLSMVESRQLHSVIRELRDQGTTIIYISHFLDEVLEIADDITIMRDGRHVRTGPASAETTDTLVQGMLGRDVELAYPDRRPPLGGATPALEVRGLTASTRFRDISFTVQQGEIVGLAGLVGSGRSEIARAIFGADRVDAGEVLVAGEPLRSRSPRRSIRRGVALLPESRQEEGLILMRSIAENVVLASLERVSRFGVVRRKAQRAAVDKMMSDLEIKAAGPGSSANSLSGGNQQKVVFAKCLMVGPRVLIVDEPTRGVDVGAKQAIYRLLTSLAADGMAILVVSSELPEVLGLSHRVLVIRRGQLVAELTSEEATEERVLAAAFGTATAAG